MIKIFLFLLTVGVFTGCVTHQSKLEEASRLNSVAATGPFATSMQDAAKRATSDCSALQVFKWELKLTDKSPRVRQVKSADNESYGVYETVCFKAESSGTHILKIASVHQGGGYSKAFYVLPVLRVFAESSKAAVYASETLPLKQAPWSGDYVAEVPLALKSGESYRVVVAADNRHPELTWQEYANSNLGLGLQGVFPIGVYSSPYGVVKLELTDEAHAASSKTKSR